MRHLQVCTHHHHYEINISTISDPLQMDCSNKSDEGGHQRKVAKQVILYSELSQKCSSVFKHGILRVLWRSVEYSCFNDHVYLSPYLILKELII